jgi:hypothetical protein
MIVFLSIMISNISKEISNKITKHHCAMSKNSHIRGVPESCFSSISEGITFMSNAQSTPQAVANEAPKTPAPGVATPPPQQNQDDKPATKPAEQQK